MVPVIRDRSLRFWIALTFAIAVAGFAADKGFADNTPPYNEPLIASIGLFVFLLSTLAFVVLCTVALARWVRGRGTPSQP